MHPFGGTPICPRCSKAVYLAEQAMGPARKLYHKPCLACTICNKRLDSYNLLEHDEQPYCKSCHLKNFGTRDLRHANLPYAQPPEDRSTSPVSLPSRAAFPPAALIRPLTTGNGSSSQGSSIPRLRPNRSLATSPISPNFPRRQSPPSFQISTDEPPSIDAPARDVSTSEEETEVDNALNTDKDGEDEEDATGEEKDTFPDLPERSTPSYPSNIGRPGIGTIPRTIPLSLNSGTPGRTQYRHHISQSVGSIPSTSTSTAIAQSLSKEAEDVPNTSHEPFSSASPILDGFSRSPMGQGRSFPSIGPLGPTMTGSRYGIALDGNVAGTGGVAVNLTGARKWGTGTPTCPRCMKSVYFAEQVKAVGKTFHKGCLRCIECNSILDSNRLRDHDGEPFCVRCYGKLHGPQGGGYALLGKAGG